MRRRIFLLFASVTTLMGFKPKEEEPWENRWARNRVRLRDDYLRFYRATIPSYADVDDHYQDVLRLHEAGKISDDTLAIGGGVYVRQLHKMEEWARSRVDIHKLVRQREKFFEEYGWRPSA